MSNAISRKRKSNPNNKKKSMTPVIVWGVTIGLFVGIIALLLWLGRPEDNKPTTPENLLSGKHYVEISIKNYGKIQLELDADTAPITVTNFMNYVKSGFYDGLTFHRNIEGFMMQGGDPTGTGYGDQSLATIKGEFSANGVKNDIKHERGVISMARASNNMDSASSQFFIVQKTSSYLDGNYAAFGHVISGMEVVDDVLAKTPVQDNDGTTKKEDQPVIEYIKEIEK